MKTYAISLTAMLVLAAAAVAEAQNRAAAPHVGFRGRALYSVESPYPYGSSPGYQPVYPVGPTTWYHHASTLQEGWLRGQADAMRAAGAMNVMNQQARILGAEAARLEVENREIRAESFWHLREEYRTRAAAERGPRPSVEDLSRLAADDRPDALADDALDEATGTVSWPSLLKSEAFAPHRAQMDAALAECAQGTADADTVAGAVQAADAMLAELKSRVRELPAQDYMAARRFLESLSFEIQNTAG